MIQHTALMVAPNGARLTPQDHPAIPVTPMQTIRTALACRDAGAQALHAHVRDAEAKHCLDTDQYAQILSEAKNTLGDYFPVQVTTEAFGIYSNTEQIALVRTLKPRYVSAALREIIRSPEDESTAAAFYQWAEKEEIALQHIIYDLDELSNFTTLQHRGIIPARTPAIMMVVGRYTEKVLADPHDADIAISKLKSMNAHWMMCAFGQTETTCLMQAAIAGGGMRVGFENSTQHTDGTVATSNEERVSALISAVGDQAKLCNADELHSMLGGY